MSQTLLTNKKYGNLDYVHAANIIKPMQLALSASLTMPVLKSQIHLVRQSL